MASEMLRRGDPTAGDGEVDEESSMDEESSATGDDVATTTGDEDGTGDAGPSATSPVSAVRKNRRKLTDAEKLRLMYLVADVFRMHRDVTTWRQAFPIAADRFIVETGLPVKVRYLDSLCYKLSKSLAEQSATQKRKGRPSAVSEELKERVVFTLVDPEVPAELKTLRKIKQVIPELSCLSTTTINRIFKEVQKDKLVPKQVKPPSVRKLQDLMRAHKRQLKQLQQQQQQQQQQQPPPPSLPVPVSSGHSHLSFNRMPV